MLDDLLGSDLAGILSGLGVIIGAFLTWRGLKSGQRVQTRQNDRAAELDVTGLQLAAWKDIANQHKTDADDERKKTEAAERALADQVQRNVQLVGQLRQMNDSLIALQGAMAVQIQTSAHQTAAEMIFPDEQRAIPPAPLRSDDNGANP